MINSFLDLNFELIHAATNNRYADGDDIKLVNFGPIASFSKYKLKTSSGKHIEDNSLALFIFLMYKVITSAKNTDNLTIGFDRDCVSRQRKVTKNRNQKGKNHMRIMLKDVFGSAELQRRATYGLGYKLTLTRNTDDSILNKVDATNKAKSKLMMLNGIV